MEHGGGGGGAWGLAEARGDQMTQPGGIGCKHQEHSNQGTPWAVQACGVVLFVGCCGRSGRRESCWKGGANKLESSERVGWLSARGSRNMEGNITHRLRACPFPL